MHRGTIINNNNLKNINILKKILKTFFFFINIIITKIIIQLILLFKLNLKKNRGRLIRQCSQFCRKRIDNLL